MMPLKLYPTLFHPGQTKLEKNSLVGRDKELEQINSILNLHTNPDTEIATKNILITGYRGIGKTSLLNYVLRNVYEKEPPAYYAECNRRTTFRSAFQDTFEGLGIWKHGQSRDFPDDPQGVFKLLVELNQKHILALDEASEPPSDTEDDFVRKLADLARLFCNQSDAVRHSRLLICGLPILAEKLLASHPSVARNLHHIQLDQISDRAFFQLLQYGQSKLKIHFPKNVNERLVDEAGGFPYYLHVMGAETCEIAMSRGESESVSMLHYENAFHKAYKEHRPTIERNFAKRLEKMDEKRKALLHDLAVLDQYSFGAKDLSMAYSISDSEAKKMMQRARIELSDFVRYRNKSKAKLCFRSAFIKAYVRDWFGIQRYWTEGTGELPLFQT